MKRLRVLIVLACLMIFAGSLHAIDMTKSGEETSVKKKAAAKPFPLGGFVILDNAVGWGTFLEDGYEAQPYYGMTLTLYPRWKWTKHLYTAVRIDISKEIVTNATSTNTEKHQTMLSDTIVRTAHTNLWSVPGDLPVIGGLTFGGYFDILAPTSLVSQYNGRILTVRPAFQLSNAWGPVSFKYTLSYSHYFNKFSSPVIDSGDSTTLSRFGGSEILPGGEIAVQANNVGDGLANSVLLEWSILNTGFSILLNYTVRNFWTTKSYEADEYTSEYAVTGKGQRDDTIGTVELDYALTKNLFLGLGVYSWQTPKTSDNKGFRIPFLNWKNLAANYTVVYFDIIGVF